MIDHNTDQTALTRRLLDDLLWLHAGGRLDDGLRETAAEMLAEYTDDPNRYSDGTPVEEEYDPAEGDPSLYFLASSVRPLPPPHRRDEKQERYVCAYAAERERWEQAVAVRVPTDDDELPPF
jgi:hypothetical protein